MCGGISRKICMGIVRNLMSWYSVLLKLLHHHLSCKFCLWPDFMKHSQRHFYWVTREKSSTSHVYIFSKQDVFQYCCDCLWVYYYSHLCMFLQSVTKLHSLCTNSLDYICWIKLTKSQICFHYQENVIKSVTCAINNISSCHMKCSFGNSWKVLLWMFHAIRRVQLRY